MGFEECATEVTFKRNNSGDNSNNRFQAGRQTKVNLPNLVELTKEQSNIGQRPTKSGLCLRNLNSCKTWCPDNVNIKDRHFADE